ncbi:hypothetical protein [Streptomyces sp. NPDC048106]|uniref:hypothetical protein n=1 Tax=Streptomyces sp. NPDC048106 TaxID=3155750 RepID=UPI003455A29C
MSGGAYAALGQDLHRHGLEYRNTDGLITGTVTDEGRVVLAHRDPAATAEMFAHSEDRTAYLALLQRFLDNADALGGILGGEPRSPRVLRHVLKLLRRERFSGTEQWLRAAVTSGRSYCRGTFRGACHGGDPARFRHARGGGRAPATPSAPSRHCSASSGCTSPRGGRRSGCSSRAAGSWASPPMARPSGPATPSWSR